MEKWQYEMLQDQLSINEVMLRIERKCTSFYRHEQEGWE